MIDDPSANVSIALNVSAANEKGIEAKPIGSHLSSFIIHKQIERDGIMVNDCEFFRKTSGVFMANSGAGVKQISTENRSQWEWDREASAFRQRSVWDQCLLGSAVSCSRSSVDIVAVASSKKAIRCENQVAKVPFLAGL